MAHKFFLIRHGHTFYNQADKEWSERGNPLEIQSFRWDLSFADSYLTPLGVSQCEAKVSLAHSLPVSKVFVSPLRRALQTCDILFRNHPNRPSIIVVPALHECLHNGHDVSAYLGVPFEEFSHFDWTLVPRDILAKEFIDDKYKHILNGVTFENSSTVLIEKMREINPEFLESNFNLFCRAQNTKAIWRNEIQTNSIAIVTHSSFLQNFTKKRLEDKGDWLENCEIKEFIFE